MKCRRAGWTEVEEEDLLYLLDTLEMIQSVEAEDKLAMVSFVTSMFGDEKAAMAGLQRLFRVSMGPMGEDLPDGN